MIIYYSGTGNSRFVAEGLADLLDDKIECANNYIKGNVTGKFSSEMPWIFVFPVYISTMPKIFRDFILKSELQGNSKAYFIGTCASEMGTTSTRCKQLCNKMNLTFMGARKVVMPQNYIALFKMTDEATCNNRIRNALKEMPEISSIIKSGEQFDTKTPSAFSNAMTDMVEAIYNSGFTGTKKFYAEDTCVGCGICKKLCPLNNIEMVDGKPKWIGKCIHCMACINSCPKKAIEYGKNTKDKTRFVCEKYSEAKEKYKEIK